MERLLRGTEATITVTVTAAGEPTAADEAPTVVVSRENGAILTSGSAVAGEGVGNYIFALSPANTALVDVVKAVWTAKVKGVVQTFTSSFEIVGDYLTSLTAIRASLPNGTDPSEEALTGARVLAEDWLEDACGTSFRSRYARELLDGTGGADLLLTHPRPSRLRAVRLGSLTGASLEPLGEAEVGEVQLYPSGRVFRLAGWWYGRRNIEVTYEHGYDNVPSQVARAVTKLARYFLVEDPSNYDERATSISTDTAHYTLTTPGMGGATTPIPEVNAVIQQFRFMGVG